MSSTIDRALRRKTPMRPPLYTVDQSGRFVERGETVVIRRGVRTPVAPIEEPREQSGVVALAVGAVGFVLVGVGIGLCLAPWVLPGICQ